MRNDFAEKPRKKYYPFPVEFSTPEEKEEFKNIIHGLKISRGLPIGQLALQSIKLLKETKL